MTNRVAIYARISSNRTDEKLGVERQEKACLKLAAAKGLDVVSILIDDNKSAYMGSKPREGWEKIKELIENNSIDGIVAWATDRLYRHPTDLEDIIKLVVDKKLTIYTVTGSDMDLNTTDGRQMARLLGTFATGEVERKAERQIAKHQQLAASGHWHGGKLPTGYKQIGGKGPLVIDEPIAEALRTSARLLLNGHSLRSVTRDYQVATGHQIADTALRRVLVGPVIAGIRIYSPATSRDDRVRMHLPSGTLQVPAQWEAILDEETWVSLKRLLLNPLRNTRNETSEKSLLSGLLICGRPTGPDTICGKSLGYGKQAYICNYSSGGCNKMSISTALIEEFMQGQINAVISGKAFKIKAQTVKTPDEQTELKRERLQANFDKSFDLFTQGVITSDELKSAKEKLTERLSALGTKPKSQVAAENEDAKLLSMISQWDSAGRPARRILIKSLIHRVIITSPDPVRAKANGSRFDYERAEVQWAFDETGKRLEPTSLKTLSKAALSRAKK
ncbi:recombinase family protein [Arthrobacter sp. lap29]|uniref:recombinase family protein n=1 Tax=Arthrobacter sp. lap29 TaxID=3056122 RepID=UPI0028F72014|nr:recombinase family protein [Arthrobacter sp. lap29]